METMYKEVIQISTDGTVKLYPSVSFERMKEIIGADLLEVVRPRCGGVMLVDECGLLKELPVNLIASLMYSSVGYYGEVKNGLCGDVFWMTQSRFIEADEELQKMMQEEDESNNENQVSP